MLRYFSHRFKQETPYLQGLLNVVLLLLKLQDFVVNRLILAHHLANWVLHMDAKHVVVLEDACAHMS